MKYKYLPIILVSVFIPLFSISCSNTEPFQTLTTIADARDHPAKFTDLGDVGDSVGDILTFDQPLLDVTGTVIGNNSGSCIRTEVAISFQCLWTLTFIDNADVTATIQVAGREFEKGASILSIVGGTGRYTGIQGELHSTNNNDGTFTQVLRFSLK